MKLAIVTGVPGAGKTTVAQALANSLQPATTVSTDYIRHNVHPYAKPWQSPDGTKQLRLGIASTIAVARVYLEDGFSVVVDDVVNAGVRQQYQPLITEFQGTVVLLKPKLEVAQERYKQRGINLSGHHRIKELYDSMESKDFDVTIDNTDLGVSEVVQKVIKEINR